MGKISKPQKSKKHKKMKAIDPFYTGDRPTDRYAHKFNMKPRHVGEQELSRSVKEIIRLKTVAKSTSTTASNGRLRSKDVTGDDCDFNENLRPLERGVTRPLQPAPQFKQHRGETQRAFLRRVDDETNDIIQMSKFEDKYHLNDDCDVLSTTVNSKKTKKLKRLKEKMEQKKQWKKDERLGDFNQLTDKVQFGEVALQPPTLTVRPKTKQTPQHGGTKSLLLNQYLTQPAVGSTDTAAGTATNTKCKQRRRQLCLADRVLLDAERTRVIDAYRQLKAKQMAAKHQSTV